MLRMIEINGFVSGGEEKFPNFCKIVISLFFLKMKRH